VIASLFGAYFAAGAADIGTLLVGAGQRACRLPMRVRPRTLSNVEPNFPL
jgi:hypothetical protein